MTDSQKDPGKQQTDLPLLAFCSPKVTHGFHAYDQIISDIKWLLLAFCVPVKVVPVSFLGFQGHFQLSDFCSRYFFGTAPRQQGFDLRL